MTRLTPRLSETAHATALKAVALATLALLLTTSAVASAATCATCGATIKTGTKYYTTANHTTYCSKSCLDKAVLLTCSACGKKFQKGLQSNDKNFCSRKCLETIFPSCSVCGAKAEKGMLVESKFVCEKCFTTKPKCCSCGMPAECSPLQDGRKLCADCAKTAVMDWKTAESLFEKTRTLLKDKLGMGTDSSICFELVDLNELNKLSGNAATEMEMGLFRHEQTTTTTTTSKKNWRGVTTNSKKNSSTEDKNSIYILFGLSEAKFMEVAAHEIAHEAACVKWPHLVKTPVISEGFAQFMASRVNLELGRQEMNQRLRSSPDPVYGDGYRLFEKAYTAEGWKGVEELIKSTTTP